MTWLERVRQKNFTPYTRGPDKTAKSGQDNHETVQKNLHALESGTDKTDKSESSGYEAIQKNSHPIGSGTDKTDKTHQEEASVSFVSSSGEGCTVFAEPVETIIVGYQRFSLDYDLPDGTYTPQELQRAKLLVKPGGVFRYRLRWPAGRPQPIADQDRRSGNQEGT